MNKALHILDSMEEIRQKAAEHPANYPVDYTIRLLSAIVADSFGYQNRTDWTNKLKEIPESKYATRILENNFHI